MSGDAGALSEHDVKTLITPNRTKFQVRISKFVVHAAGWLHSMVLLGSIGSSFCGSRLGSSDNGNYITSNSSSANSRSCSSCSGGCINISINNRDNGSRGGCSGSILRISE